MPTFAALLCNYHRTKRVLSGSPARTMYILPSAVQGFALPNTTVRAPWIPSESISTPCPSILAVED